MKRIITIDAGTSNLRLRLVENNKIVLEKKCSEGIKIGKEKFSERLYKKLKEIIEEKNLKNEDINYIVGSGMLTSSLGLKEVPHILTPVSLKDLKNNLDFYYLKEYKITLIPGIKTIKDYFKDENLKNLDVMRGEETEIFGIINQNEKKDFLVILPGSHNKIVEINQNQVVNFFTTLSGEIYEILTKYTILKNSVNENYCKEIDEKFLMLGYRACRKYGFNQATFILRGMDLAQELDINDKTNYLLGVAIAEDILIIEQNEYYKKYDSITIAGNSILSQGLKVILDKLELFKKVTIILENDLAVKGALQII